MRHLAPNAVALLLCAACGSSVDPAAQNTGGAGGQGTTSTSASGSGGTSSTGTGGDATGGSGTGGAATGGEGGAPLAPMSFPRDLATAVACDDGRVRVFGGLGLFGVQDSQEAYDPVANTWQTGAPANQARYGHTAALDAFGRVLTIGGSPDGQSALASVEAYDPSTDTWSVLPELPKTPSSKVLKTQLRTEGVTTDTWDREKAGIVVRRDRIGG